MKEIACLRLLSVLAVLFVALPARAQEAIDISYDIFSRNDSVAVWVDIAPFVSESRMARITDGIDLVLECRLRLATPKRFWGESEIARTEYFYRIQYQLVTENFSLSSSRDNWHSERLFASELSLLEYLQDSIEIAVVKLDSLENRRRYTLETSITSALLTEFSVDPKETDSTGSASPLRFLFEKFLSLTGFGRTTFKAKSRAFSPAELVVEP